MKLLVVTYAYAPASNPRAFRWSAIAEHWARHGHVVDVVCAPEEGRVADADLAGVRVHTVGGRVGPWLRRTLLRPRGASGAAAGRRGATTQDARRWTPTPGVPIVRRMYDATWKKLYWPDYACAWYPAASRRVQRLLDAGRYDGLITVSVPFTGHLVGLAARKRHPSLPWLVDIGDPFSFVEGTPPNNQWLFRGLNHAVERRVFAAADAVAVTTEGTRREYQRLFPESAAKVTVIPPLLSLPGNGAAAQPCFFGGGEGKLRLVYVGTFYRAIRSPEFLLTLFRSLLATEIGDRLELHLLGSLHDCGDLLSRHRDLLGTRVFVHGTVERAAASAAMREADVLVNVGNENSYQLPSKVVEYVSTGRPILNLVAGEDDSSHEFLRPLGGYFPLSSAAAPSEDRVRELVGFLRARPAPAPDTVARATAPFLTETIAGAYEAVLASAASRPGAGRPRVVEVP